MKFLHSEVERMEGTDDRWVGHASFTGKEPFFRDHFPGYPLVPGVLLLECLRATGEKALGRDGHRVRLAETSRVRFIQPVTPPANLIAVVALDRDDPLRVKGELLNSDEKKVATASLLFQAMEESR